MANARFFAGVLGGEARVRLAKSGKNAVNLNLRPSELLFDTDWQNGMMIHSRSIVPPNTSTVNFVALDYIPFVYIATVGSSGAQMYFGKDYELAGAKVSNSSVKLPGGRDRYALVVVFRAKAFDTRVGNGYKSKPTPRILIGKGGANVSNDYGIFISMPNYDVTKCDEGSLLFTSSRNMANIAAMVRPAPPISAYTDDTYQAEFDLSIAWPGYQPLFMANIIRLAGGGKLYMPNNREIDNDNIQQQDLRANISLVKNPNNGKIRVVIFMTGYPHNSPPQVAYPITIFDTPVK